MRTTRFRKLGLTAALAALTLAAGACEPISNAPPGGGEVVEESFRVGPFDLAPTGQEGDQDVGFDFDMPRPEGDFGIKTMQFDLVYENGESVAREDAHLHHIVMSTSAHDRPTCGGLGGERFAGSGAERNPIQLPDPYTYLVDAQETWSGTWHVMNTSDQQQNIYLEYDVGYQPDADAENSRGVQAFFLDVDGCGDSSYNVPGDGGPDSVHTKTRTFDAPWDGYLVTAMGHLHAGGIDVTLRDDANGHECTMNAQYEDGHGHGGHGAPPSVITQCPTHYPVEEGQQFTVISRYKNEAPLEGVMGIVRAYGWQGQQ